MEGLLERETPIGDIGLEDMGDSRFEEPMEEVGRDVGG
jgi:hypothetical protein